MAGRSACAGNSRDSFGSSTTIEGIPLTAGGALPATRCVPGAGLAGAEAAAGTAAFSAGAVSPDLPEHADKTNRQMIAAARPRSFERIGIGQASLVVSTGRRIRN